MGNSSSTYSATKEKALKIKREQLRTVLLDRLLVTPKLPKLQLGEQPDLPASTRVNPLANLRNPALWLQSGYECCYCQGLGHVTDIHEIILTRGDARGDNERELLIHDPRNCGWVDRECHVYAEGTNGTLRGILYLSRYVGWDAMYEFLQELEPYFKGIVPDKIRLIDIAREVKNGLK
jgi:hypothetical protein